MAGGPAGLPSANRSGGRAATSRRLLVGCAVAMGVLAALARPVKADSTSGALAVAASVVPNCRLTAQDLPFGAYDPLLLHAQTSLDATSSLIVTCTKNTSLKVAMGSGQHGPAAGGARRMASGNQRLAYQLFRDPDHTQVWEGGSSGVSLSAAGGRQAPDVLTIYGRIPAGQEVLAGRYADTVVATLEF